MRSSWALVVAIFLFTSYAEAQVSYVPRGILLKREGYEIKGTSRLWLSSSRFDSEGEETPYEEQEAFSVLEGELAATYGATKELQLGVGINFRQNRASVEDPSAAGEYTSVTSTGVQSVGAQLKYAFEPVDNLHYVLELFYRYNPYTNSPWDGADRTDRFVLGDDGGDYGGGLIVTWAHPSQNFVTASAHYRRPGKELSPELNWGIEGAMAWRRFALVVGVDGVYSMNQDAYSDEPLAKPPVNTGGSAIYNSINREIVAPYAGFNLALGSKWRVEARYQIVSMARSYDTGSQVSLALATRVDSDPTREIDKTFKEYYLEASVTKLSPKGQFVVIDKGLAHNVQVGQRFDFFHFDFVGGNVLLARGVVIQVGADQAVVKFTSRFSQKHPIKVGTVARGIAK